MTRLLGHFATFTFAVFLAACGKPPAGTTSTSVAPANPAAGANAPVVVLTASGVPMVALPSGEFVMGSDKGNEDEAPAHKVKVSAFLMDQFEVTHELFAKAQMPNPSHWQDNAKKPVERVRWRDADPAALTQDLIEVVVQVNGKLRGRISVAPSAQFRPMASGRACRTECQKAETVWPDRMRPEASVTVPEMMTGRRSPVASNSSSMAGA